MHLLISRGRGGGSVLRLDPAVNDKDRQVPFGVTGGKTGDAAFERAGQPIGAATNFVPSGDLSRLVAEASRAVPLAFGSVDTVLPIVDRRSRNASPADSGPSVRGMGFATTEDDAQFVREVFALVGLVEQR